MIASGSSSALRTGLVLSGGGALGAYQAGVVRALSKLDVPVQMVSGASVGALNGAVVATAPSLKIAAERLTELWNTLGSESPLRLTIPVDARLGGTESLLNLGWLGLLVGAGLAASPAAPISIGIRALSRLPGLAGFASALRSEVAFFSNSKIAEILREAASPDAFKDALPFFVSVFPSRGAFGDIAAGVSKVLGFSTAPSEFLNINDLSPETRYDAILASAALPLVFGSQGVGGNRFVDGGIGGGYSAQGNTPATPLVDAGCTHLIVSHLTAGSLWDRNQFPSAQVIEIVCQEPIERGGAMADLLSFNKEKAEFLIERGYIDTLASVGKVRALLELRQISAKAENLRDAALRDASAAVDRLDAADCSSRT